MITTTKIRALLNDIESDRVERTISTTNTDKFGQAICAFANDSEILGGAYIVVEADNGDKIGK